MVIFLFLATFCILFFLPVRFRLYYRKLAEDDEMVLEMSFFKGFLKRKWEIDLLQLTINGLQSQQKKVGHWFFWRKKHIKTKKTPFVEDTRSFKEFLDRYQHFGLGLTLLTYILPTKYHHWLLVADKLEKRGKFCRFIWETDLGTGEAATTAMAVGLLWGIKYYVVGLLSSKYQFVQAPRISIYHNFQKPSIRTVFDCIFKVKLGYIIITALIARLRYRLLKGGVGIE